MPGFIKKKVNAAVATVTAVTITVEDLREINRELIDLYMYGDI